MGISEAILKYNEYSSENWKLLNSVTRNNHEYKKNYKISNSVLETGLINEGIIEVYLKACMNILKVDEGINFLRLVIFNGKSAPLLTVWPPFYMN